MSGIRIAIVGAGAAGCFCAIELKRRMPEAKVVVFEAGTKALAKVAITGGGRCNLTNTFASIDNLKEAYPRGEKLVREAFRVLSPEQTVQWWEKEGVRLVAQEDQCIFPVSQDAMQIVRTLENLMRRLGVELRLSSKITRISEGYTLSILGKEDEHFDKVIVTSGGGSLKLLEELPVEIVPCVPSLFTFRLSDPSIKALMGTVVENAVLSLAGTKFRSRGTLLLTDWGVSGPATLKLSSYAARHLADSAYKGTLLINWLGESSESDIRSWIEEQRKTSSQKQLSSTHPEELTSRTWKHLIQRGGLREDLRWAELGQKGLNKLVATLMCDEYEIVGRCHFKEEFVTAGGVSASAVKASTLESKTCPGLYFAGEVLDIDAITGGFNLQAAWSTGYLVANAID